MIEILRSNNTVLMNFVEVLLRDAGIPSVVADGNMSVMEGSIGVLPRRLLVDDGDEQRARRILSEADLGAWVRGR
jgi:Putative prokaryotic signal transducing protein